MGPGGEMGRGSEIGFESEIDSQELGAADAQLEHDNAYGTFVVRRTRCSHEASEGRAVRTKRPKDALFARSV
jgi:hypothetical protein